MAALVPHNRKEMESLKGVGSYTAGAVLSMAYGEPEVAVDGNVLRIYAVCTAYSMIFWVQRARRP